MDNRTSEGASPPIGQAAPEDAAAFDALAKRCEAARQNDHELDCAIADLVVGKDRMAIGGNARYTGSIDAALTLVPKGPEWMVAMVEDPTALRSSDNRFYFYASIDESQVHYGQTAALALCVAALRARARAAR